ncbi:MAG: roadblock/LC7 domain-containing protein [Thermodesulfovibrionales bacterium]
MSFSVVLKDIVDKVDGALSASIIASDGIPVEEYAIEKFINLEDLSAEASAMIRDINLAAKNLRLGDAREFSIISERCGIIMRQINPDYYLAMVIKPEGNYGKARFLLKATVPRIEKEF